MLRRRALAGHLVALAAGYLWLMSALGASSCAETSEQPSAAGAGDAASDGPTDAGDEAATAPSEPALDAGAEDAPAAAPPPPPHCPPDMVLVLNRVCVDRYETSLVDADSELPLSPYYPPLQAYDQYLKGRQDEAARLLPDPADGLVSSMPFPPLPEWQRRGRYKPKAISRKGATPNGYLMMQWARDACVRAGKRLCALEEWQRACRGEQDRQFPYGDTYKQGACNVFREDHPGHVLFGKVSVGMLDPRMNQVTVKGKPLLRKTGATPTCRSVWGDDAIEDMVGNLDEWVDDPEGTFAGGFYSRSSKTGCERTVTSHTATYFDYSTGGRCCKEPEPASVR